MGKSNLEAAGVGVQTPEEGSAKIASGRTMMQQGLATTCKDRLSIQKGDNRRIVVWRMSQYER